MAALQRRRMQNGLAADGYFNEGSPRQRGQPGSDREGDMFVNAARMATPQTVRKIRTAARLFPETTALHNHHACTP